MGRSPLLLAACVFVLMSHSAAADLPPPDGQKSVGYTVEVVGTAAFPEWTVLLFPWTTSHGAPTHEHTEIREGVAVPVGRHVSPRFWVVKKRDYAEFMSSYKATGAHEDKPLDAFMQSTKVHACIGAPNVVDTIDSSDPRETVADKFEVKKIDDVVCRLDPYAGPSASGPHGSSAKAGCGRCDIGQSGTGALESASVLFGIVTMFLTRQRRRSRVSR